jgi:hypothetical protein
VTPSRDVARLLAWFDDGSLVRPSAATPNTVDLARALASLAGAPAIGLTPSAATIAETIGPAEHYVFVMVDGFGMNLVERMPAAGFLNHHVAMELTAVFPSSTAPSLTSIATGLWPAEHAVPGWFVYLPDAAITATILPWVERYGGRPLSEFGVRPETALPLPVLPPRFRYRMLAVQPSAIAGSIYSRYSTGGAEMSGYDSLAAAVATIASRIDDAREPTYTYLYIPYVDVAEHEHGFDSQPVRAALAHVDTRLARLADAVAGRARIIVSADHGGIAVDAASKHELLDGDPLLDLLLVPPTCEPRVPAFHVRDRQRDAFAAAFRARFGHRFALLTIDEADGLRLFGPEPLTTETRRRLGDFIAIPREDDVVIHKLAHDMVGFHGGLTPDEMRIPLILA